MPALLHHRRAPAGRHSLDAFKRFLEQVACADQRESQIIFSGGTKRCSRDSSNTGFLQEKSRYFFCSQTSLFDIHPRVESTARRLATKTRNRIQSIHEEVAALSILRDHGIHGVSGIAQRLNRGNLRE